VRVAPRGEVVDERLDRVGHVAEQRRLRAGGGALLRVRVVAVLAEVVAARVEALAGVVDAPVT
jgi:hypothetical protein